MNDSPQNDLYKNDSKQVPDPKGNDARKGNNKSAVSSASSFQNPVDSKTAKVFEKIDSEVQEGLYSGDFNEAPLLGDSSDVSFADKLYQQITSVIGGDNPNQFFCMGLPGTVIEKNQYRYNVEGNEPKPAFVEANESKLVNKLFDACKMTASDNGRHLQTQYKTALDMLTPRMNGKLYDAKTKLRKVLMTPYPYNFGDGTPTTGLTLQQVFYKLYGEYVAVKQKWAQMQVDKKNELAKKYPGNTAEDHQAIQNEYLEWYETTAEPQALTVKEKLGKVLNVFSPGDMEIITGILESGSGREISEARETLANVQKLNPDGGYVYPVSLYPENWFTLLDTSFTPMDLLESPAALAQRLSVLVAERNNLTTRINTMLAIIPDDETVKELKEAHTAAKTEFDAAFKELTDGQISATTDMLKTFIDVVAATTSDKNPENVPEATTARIFGIEVSDVKKVVSLLTDSASKCIDAQSRLTSAAKKATSTAMAYFEQKNLQQYKKMLLPLQEQLKRTSEKIDDLRQSIHLATTIQPKEKDVSNSSDVTPNAVPDNFTQIIINSKLSEANRQSSSAASASQSSYGVSFFFGGYSNNKSHQEAINQSFESEKDMEIQIGMSVAKVKIGREWFNPGVFLLSADMYNTSSEQIAPGKEYAEFNDERFDAMNKCIFPCFPTSFVIARDVTIKFFSSDSIASSFAQSVEDHSASGGGFFIFGGSSSSASSSSQSSSSATSTANSVTVRFTAPQILGYYLEATPADKSVSISSAQTNSNEDFISVFDFIKVFQEMLDDYNKTYNKQTLKME